MNLTKIASLPMGPGCLSSLPPEVGEAPTVVMKAEYFWDEECYPPLTDWPVIVPGMLE